MKLTSRERKLIILLVFVLLSYGYFQFILNPQLVKLKSLRAAKIRVLDEIQKTETVLSTEEQINKDYGALHKDIQSVENSFFSSIEHDYLLVLLTELIEKSGFKVTNMEFQPRRIETIGEQEIEATAISLPYTSSHESLFDFLRVVREYPKKIIIQHLMINTTEAGELTGNVVLDFYRISKNSNEPKDTVAFHTEGNDLDNPFQPFEEYITEEEVTTEEEYADYFSGSIEPYYPPTAEGPDRTLIHDFEKNDLFLIGNPKTTVSSITSDSNHKSGKKSVRVEYDFLRPRKDNMLHLVFDENRVIIPKQAQTISLWIYAFEKSDHRVSIVMKDANGKDYEIPMVSAVDWLQWENLEASLPVEMTYPVEIQRMAIGSSGTESKTKGIFLLDQLEVIYADVLPYTNQIGN